MPKNNLPWESRSWSLTFSILSWMERCFAISHVKIQHECLMISMFAHKTWIVSWTPGDVSLSLLSSPSLGVWNHWLFFYNQNWLPKVVMNVLQASMSALQKNLKSLLHVPEYMVPSLGCLHLQPCNSSSNTQVPAINMSIPDFCTTSGKLCLISQRDSTAAVDGGMSGCSRNGLANKSFGSHCPNPSSSKYQRYFVQAWQVSWFPCSFDNMYTQIYLQFRTCVVYHKLYWYQTFAFIFIWMNVIHTHIYIDDMYGFWIINLWLIFFPGQKPIAISGEISSWWTIDCENWHALATWNIIFIVSLAWGSAVLQPSSGKPSWLLAACHIPHGCASKFHWRELVRSNLWICSSGPRGVLEAANEPKIGSWYLGSGLGNLFWYCACV
jgi:hypothetical protein